MSDSTAYQVGAAGQGQGANGADGTAVGPARKKGRMAEIPRAVPLVGLVGLVVGVAAGLVIVSTGAGEASASDESTETVAQSGDQGDTDKSGAAGNSAADSKEGAGAVEAAGGGDQAGADEATASGDEAGTTAAAGDSADAADGAEGAGDETDDGAGEATKAKLTFRVRPPAARRKATIRVDGETIKGLQYEFELDKEEVVVMVAVEAPGFRPLKKQVHVTGDQIVDFQMNWRTGGAAASSGGPGSGLTLEPSGKTGNTSSGKNGGKSGTKKGGSTGPGGALDL